MIPTASTWSRSLPFTFMLWPFDRTWLLSVHVRTKLTCAVQVHCTEPWLARLRRWKRRFVGPACHEDGRFDPIHILLSYWGSVPHGSGHMRPRWGSLGVTIWVQLKIKTTSHGPIWGHALMGRIEFSQFNKVDMQLFGWVDAIGKCFRDYRFLSKYFLNVWYNCMK